MPLSIFPQETRRSRETVTNTLAWQAVITGLGTRLTLPLTHQYCMTARSAHRSGNNVCHHWRGIPFPKNKPPLNVCSQAPAHIVTTLSSYHNVTWDTGHLPQSSILDEYTISHTPITILQSLPSPLHNNTDEGTHRHHQGYNNTHTNQWRSLNAHPTPNTPSQ